MKLYYRSFTYKFCLFVTVFSLLCLYAPLLFLIISSFSFEHYISLPDRLSLKWYQALFNNSQATQALQTSLLVATLSMLGSTLLGTCTAIGTLKLSNKLEKVFSFLTAIPMLMPEIVLGLSLLVWFSIIRLNLGLNSLLIAHITFSVSYVILIVRSGLLTQDPLLIDAAKDLGAKPWTIFWHITLPHIMPHIFSGAIIAFTLSFDDFLITFFTAGVQQQTLPIYIYSLIKLGITPEISALSSLLLITTGLLVWLLFYFFKKPFIR